MPGFIGVPELIVLAIALLLIFGPRRLPEIGRSLGKGMREFKDSVTSVPGEFKDAISTTSDETSTPKLGATAEIAAWSGGGEPDS
jgi:sec-independent protein translocase protein TatA